MANVDVEGFSTMSGISAGNLRFIDYGNSASGSVLGDTHGRFSYRIASGWTAAAPTCINWSFNAMNTAGRTAGRIMVDGCDGSRAPSGTVFNQFPSSTPSVGQRRISHTRNNQLVGTFSNTTGVGQTLALGGGFQEYDVTAGASPYTWINETTVDVRVVVSGGTVSAIDFSYDSGGTFQAGKLTGISFFDLRPGEAIKITHTAAPALFVFPRL
jgi:hypothetical protein